MVASASVVADVMVDRRGSSELITDRREALGEDTYEVLGEVLGQS